MKPVSEAVTYSPTEWEQRKSEVEERKSRGGPGRPFHTETLDFINQWTS